MGGSSRTPCCSRHSAVGVYHSSVNHRRHQLLARLVLEISSPIPKDRSRCLPGAMELEGLVLDEGSAGICGCIYAAHHRLSRACLVLEWEKTSSTAGMVIVVRGADIKVRRLSLLWTKCGKQVMSTLDGCCPPATSDVSITTGHSRKSSRKSSHREGKRKDRTGT